MVEAVEVLVRWIMGVSRANSQQFLTKGEGWGIG